MDIAFEITKVYFKEFCPLFLSPALPSELLQVHSTVPGALLSYTNPYLVRSPAFPAMLKERMAQRLCTKETPLQEGRGPVIVSMVSDGDKGQPKAISTGQGSCTGNPSTVINPGGNQTTGTQRHLPVHLSLHYTAVSSSFEDAPHIYC